MHNPTHHTNELSLSPPISAPKTASSSYLDKPFFTIHRCYSWVKTMVILALLLDSFMATLFLLASLPHGTGKSIYEALHKLRGAGNIAALSLNLFMCTLFRLASLLYGAGKFIYEVIQELRGRGNIARRNNRRRRA
jgi:hypothetical protein